MTATIIFSPEKVLCRLTEEAEEDGGHGLVERRVEREADPGRRIQPVWALDVAKHVANHLDRRTAEWMV